MRVLYWCVLIAMLSVAGPGIAAGSSKDRVKEARALAKEGLSGIEKLQPYQNDEDAGVRRAAVESLLAIGGPQTLEPLTLSLGDVDGEVQRLAAIGIVNFYLPGYYQTGWRAKLKRGAESLFEHFIEPEEPVTPAYVRVRPRIVAALGKVVAESPSMSARAEAARALGILRGKEASDQLLAALATKNDEVLYEVLTAFEKIRNPEVAPKLFYLLRDPDEKVQLAAIETVSLLGNKDANPSLREAWDRTKSDKVRRALLEAMAMLPDEANRPLFERYLLDQDEELRAAAAEGIGRLGRAEDLARVVTLWEGERKMRPRLSLAFAVVALGNREMTDLSPLRYLVNTLNHGAWKGVAQGFLKDLVDDAVVRFAIHNAMLQGNKAEKIGLAQVLGARGTKDSVDPLERLGKDADPDVATVALRALRTLRLRLH
jgi:HEAT repeat protein